MKKKISNWSNNLNFDAKVFKPKNYSEIKKILENNNKFIARGSGFNYGDSTFSNNVINLEKLKKKIKINIKKKVIECTSNVTLNEILDFCEKRRLTLAVLPGTGKITLGGAIASDVHGKNHIIAGSFCNYLEEITIICSNGKILKCSEKKYKDLFRSTCAGMGLTGIILKAKLRLVKLKSNTMEIKNFFFQDYKKLVNFISTKNTIYSITWIDFYSIKRTNLRAIFSEGNFLNKNEIIKKNNFKIPHIISRIYFNKVLIKFFNIIFFYFKKNKNTELKNYRNFLLPFDNFSYNKNFYGNDKIVQVQIIIKKKDFNKKLIQLLNKLKILDLDCYLIGIKKFGVKNMNFLSFPEKGYTITVDILLNNKSKKKIKILQNYLIKEKFKINLTKDILLEKKIFYKTYPNAKKFLDIKNKYDKKNKFNSSMFSRIYN